MEIFKVEAGLAENLELKPNYFVRATNEKDALNEVFLRFSKYLAEHIVIRCSTISVLNAGDFEYANVEKQVRNFTPSTAIHVKDEILLNATAIKKSLRKPTIKAKDRDWFGLGRMWWNMNPRPTPYKFLKSQGINHSNYYKNHLIEGANMYCKTLPDSSTDIEDLRRLSIGVDS